MTIRPLLDKPLLEALADPSVGDGALIPNFLPINWKAGPMVGRQAETIPADISIAVQPTVWASVYVGSVAL